MIAEQVRLENVQANMETAMEELPEGFGRVIMLYVDVEINGHPVKAFVDRSFVHFIFILNFIFCLESFFSFLFFSFLFFSFFPCPHFPSVSITFPNDHNLCNVQQLRTKTIMKYKCRLTVYLLITFALFLFFSRHQWCPEYHHECSLRREMQLDETS